MFKIKVLHLNPPKILKMDKEVFGIAVLEWIGYVASLIILISYITKNITTLRIIGTIGCLLFVVYGTLIESWPLVITNVSIVLINLYYIFIKINKKPD
jgi:uncharacterized protein with PQ loop repeat